MQAAGLFSDAGGLAPSCNCISAHWAMCTQVLCVPCCWLVHMLGSTCQLERCMRFGAWGLTLGCKCLLQWRGLGLPGADAWRYSC